MPNASTLNVKDDYAMLIGGRLRKATDGSVIDSVNPATGQVIATFPAATTTDVDLAARAAERAAPGWRSLAATERAAFVGRLADAVAGHAEELARLDTADSGSLLSEMRRDADGAVAALRYFAGLALHPGGTTLPSPAGELTYTSRVPYGVVGRLVAFNHPLLFAASKIAAPLLAGNSVLLKPSEHTSLSALRLGELAADILPEGVLNVVTGDGRTAGDALVAHPAVRRLAFIGSLDTGLAIQRRAAEQSVKTVTLELGGKNPLVVFPDADLDTVVEAAVRGMNFTWQGQSCGSLSRVLVHRSLHDAFVERLTERVAALSPGLPDDPASQMGALVNEQQLRKVLYYVQVGREEGARLCTGGERVTEGALGAGLFVRPAVFADVDPGSRLAHEEIFGPVLSVLSFRDEAEAIALANSTRFGLTASVFTNDLATAHRFAEAVEAGYVWVNQVARHIPGAPYGGFKDSGIGSEEDLGELLSYTQPKNVHIKYA
ncbi:aldehyde dehydrogenase family protein [Streptomyces sp. NPDC048430]|uniref:aldehyde dehydrogenase family protein n=1 Tax=Streptomyces sp. NPDC048430 TaxID=3155388 RepID=UPI003420273D